MGWPWPFPALAIELSDTLRIDYAAADTSICVATASLVAVLDWLRQRAS